MTGIILVTTGMDSRPAQYVMPAFSNMVENQKGPIKHHASRMKPKKIDAVMTLSK